MLFWYKLFYGFCWLLALLPFRCLYLFSDLLFVLVCYVVRYRRKVVLDNLRNSFPEKTERERRQIARKFYLYLCDVFIETIKLTNINRPHKYHRIHLVNPEIIDDLHRKGKQVFLISGHYGNWEWLATLENSTPYHHAFLYHPLENQLFDKFFCHLRTKFGSEAIPTNTAVRVINRYIQENRLIMLLLLSDQSPPRNAIHYWTTFLNQETPVFLVVEKLARRYNTAVVYCEILHVKRGYYEGRITLITENAAETAETEITEKHVQLLEQSIRRNPQYWLWSHRRWKHKRE